jgi:hypothetical protein
MEAIGVSPVGGTKTSRGGDKVIAVRGGENDVAGGSTSTCTGGDGLARFPVAGDSRLVSSNGDGQ